MAVELTKEEIKDIIPSVLQYFSDDMDMELSDLKVRLLLDFFVSEIGAYGYNQGVNDSQRFMQRQLDDLKGTCHEYPADYWEKRTRKK